MGNNPMVGATVAVAVSVEEAARAGKFYGLCKKNSIIQLLFVKMAFVHI